MKPDSFDDPASIAAEARDNRRAILVAAIALAVIVLASIVLFATRATTDGQSTPAPASTLQHQVQGQTSHE
jgi:flagellar biosynthesis/type III secretory pathway M-ring protein FliF/YscJ